MVRYDCADDGLFKYFERLGEFNLFVELGCFV